MDKKRVLISGASSGIGRATALRFAQEGWDVLITGRNEDRLAATFQELSPGNHLMIPGDYTDPETARKLGATIEASWGELNALVNCAGVFMSGHSIDSPCDVWRRPMDIMLDGAILLTRLCVPLMKNGGRVIHITSIHGERAEFGSTAYAMAKAALNQYCRGLAVELADRKILVNAIAPGFVDTPMGVIDGVNEVETDHFKQDYVIGHHLPLRRAAQPEEIAGVALFLAGPDASYITGETITVDGGLTITF